MSKKPFPPMKPEAQMDIDRGGRSIAERIEEEQLLAALALALVDKPRATLQELAIAVGVSKATLYRHSRTREELIDRLTLHATDCMQRTLDAAQLEMGPARDALSRFIGAQLDQREMTAFLVYHWQPESLQSERFRSSCDIFLSALDALILRGQHEGVFRIDVSAAAQSEALLSIISGFVDAERRGRVARAGVKSMIEALFLSGCATDPSRA